jgi:cellobiose phosphorylase
MRIKCPGWINHLEVIMQYGRFDDEKKEYVITNLFTPVKWINYIGTLDFGGFVDHTGGALICKGDPALNRITKYIPQMPASDFKGETAYLRFPLPDGSFQVVSPFHVPCATALDAWECHVGLGYTRIYSVINGLECDITIFVPPGSACEIRWYRFRNRSESTVSFDVIPVVEYSHFDALKQFTNADWVPQTMQSEAVYLAKTLILRQFAFMHRDTRSNYFTGNRPADSFETDRKIFLGNNEYGSWSNPLSMQQSSLSNHEARRGDNIAAVVYPFRSLAPGESQTLITQLGQTDNVHTTASIPYYMKEKHVAAAFEELQHFWSNYLVKLQVQTPDSAFDSLINIHNPHQSYITFNWSRYLSLYQLGLGSRGLGTRDSSQDILAVLHTIPDQAVKLLRKLISIQTH